MRVIKRAWSLIACIGLSGCFGGEYDEAKGLCEQAVEKSLAAPSAAKFSPYREMQVYVDGGYTVAQLLASSYKTLSESGLRSLNSKNGFFMGAVEMEQASKYARTLEPESLATLLTETLHRKFMKSNHLIVGYVDAQNMQGTMLRKQFICMMTSPPADDKTFVIGWKIDGLMIN